MTFADEKTKYGPPPAAELMERHMQTNQRLLMALTANDLPPPATPHGHRLKSVAASDNGRSQSLESTPVPVPSVPDLPTSTVPTSETLRATLSGDRSRQTRTKKHGMSSEESEESTAKRVATSFRTPLHFTSLRSLKVIDADGKSSPAQYGGEV